MNCLSVVAGVVGLALLVLLVFYARKMLARRQEDKDIVWPHADVARPSPMAGYGNHGDVGEKAEPEYFAPTPGQPDVPLQPPPAAYQQQQQQAFAPGFQQSQGAGYGYAPEAALPPALLAGQNQQQSRGPGAPSISTNQSGTTLTPEERDARSLPVPGQETTFDREQRMLWG
ncbi:hypothetical protein MNV49_005042 [Pseudohyphozyma bogoriensis]|nr:hypothetical protein MNV49_005042 [Pseudohyphozyma bogoriensis]